MFASFSSSFSCTRCVNESRSYYVFLLFFFVFVCISLRRSRIISLIFSIWNLNLWWKKKTHSQKISQEKTKYTQQTAVGANEVVCDHWTTYQCFVCVCVCVCICIWSHRIHLFSYLGKIVGNTFVICSACRIFMATHNLCSLHTYFILHFVQKARALISSWKCRHTIMDIVSIGIIRMSNLNSICNR